jgi:putative membrane protein
MSKTIQQPIDYEKKYRKLIIALSIIIPLAVAGLFGIKVKGTNFSFLPPIYATINGITATVLIISLIAIKNKLITMHQRLNTLAVVLSSAFLVMYVLYHITSEETKFGDVNHDGVRDAAETLAVGGLRYLYFALLISHIALSVIVIPFVLFTYVKGMSMKVQSHKKLARVTYPMWLYVAISGVVVYMLLSPYYK